MKRSVAIIERLALVVFVLLVQSPRLFAQSASSSQARTISDAFLLGFSYANGHNLYSRNADFSGKVRSQFNSWMSDASSYGRRLGVTVDVSPPPIDTSDSSRQASILRSGRHQANVIGISLRAKHGDAPTAGLTLGYLSGLAVEYVPYLSASMRQEVFDEYFEMAAKMNLPRSVVNEYTQVLATSQDRAVVVHAMFGFKDAVVGYFEQQELASGQGAGRQLQVWSLGWSLGVATLGQARGADPGSIERMFQECRARAGLLGVQLPALPEVSATSASSMATALHYLLTDAGDEIGGKLSSLYGPHASALFEVALKSTIAIVLYSPGDELGQTLTKAINDAATRAGLPANIYRPLVSKMTAGLSAAEIKEEAMALNKRVEEYYGGAAYH